MAVYSSKLYLREISVALFAWLCLSYMRLYGEPEYAPDRIIVRPKVGVSDADIGTASVSGSIIIYTPPSGWSGRTIIQFVASDESLAASASAELEIVVGDGDVIDLVENRVLWLPFNEGTGTQASDFSGSNHNATLRTGSNEASWATGRNGGFALRPGSSSTGGATIPDHSDLRLPASFTTSAWLRMDGVNTARDSILSKGKWDYLIGMNGNRPSLFSSNFSSKEVGANEAMPGGKWSHLTIVKNGNVITSYKDGVYNGRGTTSGSLGSGSSDLIIGADSGTVSGFRGLLDDVMIHRRALGLAEIRNLSGINNCPWLRGASTTMSSGTSNIHALDCGDPEDGILTARIVTLPANGTATVSGTTVTYAPTATFSGMGSLVVEISDGALVSNQATLTYTVVTGGGGIPASTFIDPEGRIISGNVWKHFPLDYYITAKSILQVTVISAKVGEILGVALDNDEQPTTGRRGFLLGGSDYADLTHVAWSWKLNPVVISGGAMRTYNIPIGAYFTGNVSGLGLVGDDDATGTINASFSNLKLYEGDIYEVISAGFDWGSVSGPNRLALADANCNGVANLLEFAFNLSPTAPGSAQTVESGTGTQGLPTITVENATTNSALRIEYLRRKDIGLKYSPQFSSNLVDWVEASGTPMVSTINSNWERVVVSDSAGAGQKKRFGKVKVSEAP